MDEFAILLVLTLVAVLSIVAKWSRQPYPIVFLLGGIVLAFVPGMPVLRLAPELVFLIFLPPLIFGDAYVTDWRQFKRYLEPIALLATGLVVVTSVTVAYVAHWLIGLPLDVGFVLGAILSPTDTVATDAIAEETGMPSRLQIILSGESLINDATGLVLYKFAVAAVIVGTFSLGAAVAQFCYVAIVGLGVGILGGIIVSRVTRSLHDMGLTDEVIAVTITLVTPFLVYLVADRIGASGVLAAAAAGMYVARVGGGIYTPESRLVARGVWNTLFFVFNGALFILLGLQLRSIFTELAIFPARTLIVYGLGISAAVILARLVWVFATSRIRRMVDRGVAEREGERPPRSWTFVLGWAGMRGIVSLAAALSLPDTVAGGAPFPARDLILFVTFAVILVTLLGQGLTLPLFLKRFAVVEADAGETVAAKARVRIAEAALRRLTALEAGFTTTVHWEIAGRLQSKYADDAVHYRAHMEGTPGPGDAVQHEIERRLIRETLQAERIALDDLRYAGEITDDVFRRIQYDIDLAETRLLA